MLEKKACAHQEAFQSQSSVFAFSSQEKKELSLSEDHFFCFLIVVAVLIIISQHTKVCISTLSIAFLTFPEVKSS